MLAASDAPVFRHYWRKKIQTFILIPHIAPMVILRGWQENPHGWCYKLVYAFHGTILKFSETIFKSSPSWGHLVCLQLWCCICSFRISLFLWSTLHTHTQKHALCPVSAPLLKKSVVPTALVISVRKTNISCKGNRHLLLYRTLNRHQKGHTAVWQAVPRTIKGNCLPVPWPTVHFSQATHFIHLWLQRCFFEGKNLFSCLVALNAGLSVSVEYSSSFNDLCPVTYRVLSFSQHCNKMIFASLVLSSYYCTFKFCFVCSVLSW